MLPKTAKDTKDSQSRLDFFLMWPKYKGAMCYAYLWKGKGTRNIKASSEAGFLASLDEALLNCGEVALVVEQDGDATKFVSYTLPRWGNNFEDGEIRNAFLSQMMENKCFEDSDRELLSKYLDAHVLSEIGRKQEAMRIDKNGAILNR